MASLVSTKYPNCNREGDTKAPSLLFLFIMHILTTPNYDYEDLIPLSVVREHLRYEFGDAEALVKEYTANACDYIMQSTGRTFSSPDATAQVEDSQGTLGERGVAYLSTKEIHFTAAEVRSRQCFRIGNLHGNWAVTAIKFAGEAADQDETAFSSDWGITVQQHQSSWYVDFANFDESSLTIDDFGDKVVEGWAFRVTIEGGQPLTSVPRAYRQAALLLVGHYDTQREAEFTGGITTEIKEGVNRLLASVRSY